MSISTVSAGDKTSDRNAALKIILFSVIIFLSRQPFLSAGYGVDNDSWRFASVARNIAVTGEYQYSRAPGHPVQEYICSLYWDKGPLWMNGSTAIMSVIAAVFFMLILKELRFRNIFLPALAFALTPVIYINSVNSMDNLWNLAFLLGSLYFILKSKPVGSGIMLGIANGCRLTSAVMVFPFSAILYYRNKSESPKKNKSVLIFIIAAAVTTVIFYIPGLLTFGTSLFTDVAWAYPGWGFIAFRYFISTWGLLGFAAIAVAVTAESIIRLKKKRQGIASEKYIEYSMFAAVLIYTVIFLLMPHKPSYLVPVIPFILILLARFLSYKLFNIVCIALILSPFLLGVSRTDMELAPEASMYSVKAGSIIIDPFIGPILAEHSKRLRQVDYGNKIISAAENLQGNSVLVTGELYPIVIMLLKNNIKGGKIFDHINENVLLEYTMTQQQLRDYKAEGFAIYYLPGEEVVTKQLYGIDLISEGAKNLFEIPNP